MEACLYTIKSFLFTKNKYLKEKNKNEINKKLYWDN